MKLTESRRIFEGLKSLYIMAFSKLWRKWSPLAAPIIIVSLVSQESGRTFAPPAQAKIKCIDQEKRPINFPKFLLTHCHLLPNRWLSKLPQGINSYTRNSLLSSLPNPNNLTRLGWESLPKKLTSDCTKTKSINQYRYVMGGGSLERQQYQWHLSIN